MDAHATERGPRAPGRFIFTKQTSNTGFVRCRPMEVVIVRWPAERDRREQLAKSARPRLLLVDDGEAPPPVADCLEDWARAPIDDADLRARIAALEQRASAHHRSVPVLDDDGVLHDNDAWVALPPVEARLMGALLDRSGAVVSRETLARAGWPDGAPGRNALDVHVLRLRRRVDPLGLVIRTVRSRGYLLETGARQMASPA
jgi:DNA-binding winged helix-turn-helix (wHTH) protein